MMKICIIDDERICSFLAQKLIKKLVPDSQISHFSNGQEAIDFIAQHRSIVWSLPELIFLDINMPITNGWDFLDILQELKISNYHPLIYISSSSQDVNDIEKAKTYSSVRGYLCKPLTPLMLERILDNTSHNCVC
ncbi:response regulator [Dyadobacter frigoris]|nr:response regulator [Dyadobacter frigoris]